MNKSLSSEERRIARERAERRRQNQVFIGILIFIGLVSIPAIAIAWSRRNPFSFNDGEHSVRLSKPEGVLTFAKTKPTVLHGHSMAAKPRHGTLQDFGSSFEFQYLSPSSYQTFLHEYQNTTKCRASFYNWNMNLAFIMDDRRDLLDALSRCNLKEGEEFALEGRFLQFMKGHAGRSPIRISEGRFSFFLLEKILKLPARCS